MKDRFNYLQSNYIALIDLMICLPFLIVPLMLDVPYRVNIFLSWEGAYRLLLGQFPFVDFGLPLGFGYWLIPALFFKLFGPELITLIKAQVFINALSLLAVRGILYQLRIKPLLVSLALIVFCLTYVIFNFWPWYNHSVIVFELIALYFIVRSATSGSYHLAALIAASLFAFLAFFTKQDAGAIAFVIGAIVLLYQGISHGGAVPLLTYIISFMVIATITIVPLIPHDFLYWFNYGQPPHNPRIGLIPILDVVFSARAIWEKTYLLLIGACLLALPATQRNQMLKDRHVVIQLIITVALIGQAMITRVSSPLPTNHMTYFHAFGVVMLCRLAPAIYLRTQRWTGFIPAALMVTLLFSGGYWKYMKGILGLTASKHDSNIPRRAEPWKTTDVTGFKNVKMPSETVQGIQQLLASPLAGKEDLKVLNMTELTPLALELNYTPPTNQPLWYHLNVGIFQKEIDELSRRVREGHYDLVLFQDIPGLIHFFPYDVQATLKEHYELKQRFLAPRKLENSYIEVYSQEP
ncbi:hypothetical protein [Marinoscillum furvescens]|uniref:Dolichyl-phosphate-mannose-protein mannosyltransferase n=1 Tax=Marinoscillum furvescens DSM 4134 TaxID=1122208 RepID=A0A3D9L311_MARFU|nr:hypothetical protein [Marinoscillum furvescens]RED97072.1 hypothetical protein C7460_113121 [Marinoscillum furvescens DSM 4134]